MIPKAFFILGWVAIFLNVVAAGIGLAKGMDIVVLYGAQTLLLCWLTLKLATEINKSGKGY
jgi:hypothetical protein